MHPAGSFEIESVPRPLRSLLPKGREAAEPFELVPEGALVTYGIGASLSELANRGVAKAHVPVG